MFKKKSLIIGSLFVMSLIIILGQKDKISFKTGNIFVTEIKEGKNNILDIKEKSHSVEEDRAESINLEIKLSDSNIKVEKRISYLINLDLNHNQNATIKSLIKFIVLRNPYNEGADPYSVEALSYQKEVALKIFAIRKLSEGLNLEKFNEIVLEIEKRGEDDALKNVALKALDSKKQGRNYFEDTIKAIEEMPQPQL